MQIKPTSVPSTFEKKIARLRQRLGREDKPRGSGGSKSYGTGKRCAKVTREDAAYIAGFIDGEGCISAWRRKKDSVEALLHLTVTVINTNRDILDWIAAATCVGSVNNAGKGTVRTKRSYIWQIDSTAAASLVEQLLPFLKIKRKQAFLLMRAHRRAVTDVAGARDRTWQNGVLSRSRILNRKGPISANATVRLKCPPA